MSKIKIGIIGVGNCASALLQGIQHYKHSPNQNGLITEEIGGYTARDIEVVCAFDVNKDKCGEDISDAIEIWPNCVRKFANVPHQDVPVSRGQVWDGVGDYKHLNFEVIKREAERDNIIQIMRDSGAEIIVNYLPVGSEHASVFYAECAIGAGCSFINAIPVFICTNKDTAETFKRNKLVCAGDDIKSQVGATILHRTLVNLIKQRGQEIHNSYQLNFGGNTDFENMLDRSRLRSKEQSKTQAVTSQYEKPFQVKIGPSDFVPHLEDQKICYINIEGEQFGGAPFEIECKLKVHDSPNSAGVMVDAIRCAKLAIDREQWGYLEEASACFFKTNIRQTEDVQAHKDLLEWIG